VASRLAAVPRYSKNSAATLTLLGGKESSRALAFFRNWVVVIFFLQLSPRFWSRLFAAVDWFDSGYVQQVAIDQVFWKLFIRLGQGNKDLALHHEYHFGLPHVVCRPIREAYTEWLKRLTEEVVLDRFWSHGLCSRFRFFIRPCISIVAPPMSVVNKTCRQEKITPAEDFSFAGALYKNGSENRQVKHSG
jgi:hypothetical protein